MIVKYSNKRIRLDLAVTSIIILLAVAVMFGWWFRVDFLVQWLPSAAPMQFNTALGFLLSGGALFFYLCEKPAVCRFFACIALILASLTLTEYVLGVNLGIDELFVDHYIETDTSHPGRMAPNTAIIFVLLSLTLIIPFSSHASLLRQALRSTLISLMLVIAMVALLGYLTGVEGGYGWGALTQMALPTALGFMLANLILCWDYFNKINFLYRWRVSSFQLSLLMLGLSFALWQALKQNEKDHADRYTHAQTMRLESEFNLQWNELQSDLERLQAAWLKTPQGETDRSQKLMSQSRLLIREHKTITAIVKFEHGGYRWWQPDKVELQDWLKKNVKPSIDTIQVHSLTTQEGVFPQIVQFWSLQEQDTFMVSVIDLRAILADVIERFMLTDIRAKVFYHNREIYSSREYLEEHSRFLLSKQLPDIAISIYLKKPSITFADWVLCLGIVLSILGGILIYFLQKSIIQARILDKEIDEKAISEAALNVSQNIVAVAAQASGLGIWTWNPQSNQVELDRQLAQMLGEPNLSSIDNLASSDFAMYLHPVDRERVLSGLERFRGSQDVWKDEFRVYLKSGEMRYLKSYATRINQQQKCIVVGGCLDISAEQNMWQHLQQLTEKAEEANQAKTDFLANVSHELRTPMNGIIGIGELLARTQLNGKQQEYLSLISQSANSLLSILNDILDLSKIEAGKLHVKTSDVCVNDLVTDIIRTFAPVAHGKKIDLQYYIEPETPSMIIADPVKLSQILVNLLGNAVKFTRKGNVQLKVSWKSDAESDMQNGLKFVVSDTGIGVERSMHDTIFAPFMQADSSTSRDFGGTGLGLSIVTKLVKLLHGSINFDSEPGLGTTVSVTIPVHIIDEDRKLPQDHLNCTHSKALDKHVLLMSNNVDTSRWINTMLKTWGANLTVQSLNKPNLPIQDDDDFKWDLILLDYEFEKSHREIIGKSVPILKAKASQLALMVPAGLCEVEEKKLNCWSFCHGIQQRLLKPLKQSELYELLINQIDAPRQQMVNQEKPSSALNVLIAEDNRVNQMLVVEILKQRGHHTTVVENGRAAVTAVQSQQFDVVLMDVQMPHLDGLEATREIRRLEKLNPSQRALPIIGLTARALTGDREACLRAGMSEYLSKPLNAEGLVKMIERLASEQKPYGAVNETEQDGKQTVADTKLQFVDYSRCMATTGNNHSLYLRMCRHAANQLRQQVEELEIELKANEFNRVSKLIHRLKGTIGGFCVNSLLEECISLEALFNEEPAQHHDKWDTFRKHLYMLATELDSQHSETPEVLGA